MEYDIRIHQAIAEKIKNCKLFKPKSNPHGSW